MRKKNLSKKILHIKNLYVNLYNDKQKIYGDIALVLITLFLTLNIRFFFILIANDFVFINAHHLLQLFLQDYLIFILTFLTFWITITLILGEKIKNTLIYILPTQLIFITPPIIDLIVTGGGSFWSFYLLSDFQTLLKQFFTFFNHLPGAVTYFGTKIMIFIGIFGSGFIVWFLKRSIYRALFSSLATYCIFFFYAAFPSFFSYVYYQLFELTPFYKVTLSQISQLFISPHEILFKTDKQLHSVLSYKVNIIYSIILIFTIFLLQKNKLRDFYKNSITGKNLFLYTNILFYTGLVVSSNQKPGNILFSILLVTLIILFYSKLFHYIKEKNTTTLIALAVIAPIIPFINIYYATFIYLLYITSKKIYKKYNTIILTVLIPFIIYTNFSQQLSIEYFNFTHLLYFLIIATLFIFRNIEFKYLFIPILISSLLISYKILFINFLVLIFFYKYKKYSRGLMFIILSLAIFL